MYSLLLASFGPITLYSVGAPSENGAILNTCKKLEPKEILLTITLNSKILGESTPP
jgi:hypothetical protein